MPSARPPKGEGQQVWILFGGRADMAWQRLLSPRFRHCFAAILDDRGWTLLDPMTNRLLVERLDLPADFDLPRFYRRAGFASAGPFVPAPARASLWPAIMPMNCVGLCRATLGGSAPFALTPHGLHRALTTQPNNKKKFLTSDNVPDYKLPINGRAAPASRLASLKRLLAFFVPPTIRSVRPMGSVFSAPKPVVVSTPAQTIATPAPTGDEAASAARTDNQARLRRGLQGTIATSERGVLAAAPAVSRKTLLGE
ncbi:hypothetical protein [Rhodovarius crocodyli]|nr:hypothetical protein [Rhodovarius crocodyli]